MAKHEFAPHVVVDNDPTTDAALEAIWAKQRSHAWAKWSTPDDPGTADPIGFGPETTPKTSFDLGSFGWFMVGICVGGLSMLAAIVGLIP